MTLNTHTFLLDYALVRVAAAYDAARREVFDRLPGGGPVSALVTPAQRYLLDELERAERALADIRYGWLAA